MFSIENKQIAIIGGGDSGYRLLDEIAQGLAARGASVSDFPEIETFVRFLEQELPVDVVIIRPGYWQQSTFMDTTSADWQTALSKNFEEAVFGAQAAARHMIAHQIRGQIIFLSSVAGTMSLRDSSAVGTTLAALHAIARMAAVDLAPYGITVNVIAAASAEGALADHDWQPHILDQADSIVLQAHIPIGRRTSPADLINLCAFLASEAARYLTGAIIPLDGGYTLTKAGAGTPPKR